jgi:methionine-rich copper-binding protein CopC
MKPVLALFLALSLTTVLAHATLERSSPAANSTLKTPPKSVILELAEPVEVRLSTFKVYPLASPASAPALVQKVLSLKGDEASRADAGLATRGETASRIEINLKEGLKPGAYVVMWRVLSVDTHVSQDAFVFTYQP